MAKKEKRVSVNALERAVEGQIAPPVTVQWYDTEVTVRPILPFTEAMEFVQDIVANCFLSDGTYIPEVMPFVINSGILTRYANFNLPTSSEKQYWLIYNSDVVDMVTSHINTNQLEEIVSSAKRKVEHIRNSDVIEMRKKLDRIIAVFEDMENKMAGMFDGLDADDLQALVQAMGQAGSLSEDKIVAAYVDKLKEDAGVETEDDAT